MLLSRKLYPSYNQESWSQSRAHIGSTPETLFQKELLQPKICICLPQRLRRNPSSSSAPNGHWAPRLLDWFSCRGTLGSPFQGAASPHSTNQSVLRKINANTLLKDELWTLFQSSELNKQLRLHSNTCGRRKTLLPDSEMRTLKGLLFSCKKMHTLETTSDKSSRLAPPSNKKPLTG